MHEGITVKVLLDSSTTEMFMDKKMAARNRFKLQKLERPVVVRNVNGMNNSRGTITHQVEVNVCYKSHVERMRIDVCDLGRIDVILGMLWLQAHSPEINWETGEVKMTRYLPIYGRSIAAKKKTEKRRKVERRIRAIGKSDRDEWKLLMEKFDDEVELDREKVRKMVPQRFYKWLKVFKKAEPDEVDPDSQKENGQLIYWIKCCPKHSTSIEKVIQLLDKKQEEEA